MSSIKTSHDKMALPTSEDTNRIAFVVKKKRTLNDIVNSFVDFYIVKRVGSKSREFNLARKGNLAIFANDYIGIQINQYGVFEGSDLDLVFSFLDPILDNLKEGMALDIGANIGNHSIYFSRIFKSVLAFEPHPQIHALLLFNSKIAPNIQVFNFGLGETTKAIHLNENWDNMGSSSIKHSWVEDGGKVLVNLRRLDELELGHETISLIKIDVEGFESSVLLGAKRTIQEYQPLILIEQLESEFIGALTPSIDILHEEGYVFCWYQPWAASRGWMERKVNTMRNIFLGTTYDINFLTAKYPPPATYPLLIAVPKRFQNQLLIGR
jgi:FkbM family methyltransferase